MTPTTTAAAQLSWCANAAKRDSDASESVVGALDDNRDWFILELHGWVRALKRNRTAVKPLVRDFYRLESK